MHIWKQIDYKFLWGSCVLGGPYEQIHKTQGWKKKQFFFCFPWGFCKDFLGNQTRMNFPGNQMGDGFFWESKGMDFLGNQMGWIFLGIKREFKKKKINNVIRLVPARIESGRGK